MHACLPPLRSGEIGTDPPNDFLFEPGGIELPTRSSDPKRSSLARLMHQAAPNNQGDSNGFDQSRTT